MLIINRILFKAWLLYIQGLYLQFYFSAGCWISRYTIRRLRYLCLRPAFVRRNSCGLHLLAQGINRRAHVPKGLLTRPRVADYATNIHSSRKYRVVGVRSQELPFGHQTTIQFLVVCFSQSLRTYFT